jgi:hypothetical protein
MNKTTQQPSLPWERDGKWYFTYYYLSGPKEIGPYEDQETARQESWRAVRLHQANGYTDGTTRILS